MKSVLIPRERKALEEIHKLFLELEKSTAKRTPQTAVAFFFDPTKLDTLKKLISALTQSSNADVSRLASIEKHLAPEMTLKHFSSFALPFERLLNKNLQDDDFLILEKDGPSAAAEKIPLVFVLDNLRSAFNVGSVFRTAECLGAEHVYLCGYTPLPSQWKVEKTAMGTQNYMSWSEAGKVSDCLSSLRQKGYRLIGLETATHAVDLYESFNLGPTALILGNERFGLDPELLKELDEVRIIPLRGLKNSLNVGVTAAVAGFEWMRQWRNKNSL